MAVAAVVAVVAAVVPTTERMHVGLRSLFTIEVLSGFALFVMEFLRRPSRAASGQRGRAKQGGMSVRPGQGLQHDKVSTQC